MPAQPSSAVSRLRPDVSLGDAGRWRPSGWPLEPQGRLHPSTIAPDRPRTLEAENAHLRTQLALRDGALNSAHGHFVIFDVLTPGATIVFANRSFAADYGFEPEEIIGAPFDSLGIKLWNPEQALAVDEAIRAGQAISLEAQVVRKDGTKFWAGFYLAPLRSDTGIVSHYMATGADITAKLEGETKKRELQDRLYNEMHERERLSTELRLAHKLEAVGRLAAGIAHEINTPIQYVGDNLYFLRSAFEDLQTALSKCNEAVAALPGNLQISAELTELRRSVAACALHSTNSEIDRAFERTLEGIERVAGIVKGMRDFAHPDAVKHEPADLNHAIETTLAVARSEYKHKAAIELRLGAVPNVTCNVGELNQVFLNLIVNAAQAVEESGKDVSTGRITISTGVSGSNVDVVVSDNGCGISEENLERIFDPFFTTKEVGRGTGQGLAISRSIVVDRHGGNILVRSVVGLGTHFTLRLPIGGRES